jgi:hypothetical protein
VICVSSCTSTWLVSSPLHVSRIRTREAQRQRSSLLSQRQRPANAPSRPAHEATTQAGAVQQFTEASAFTDELPNKPHYIAVTPKSRPTLRQTWPRLETSAAMCVRDVDDQGVLQFTLLHAVCCALHRRTSRVIHRLELYFISRIQEFHYNEQFKKENSEAAGLMMGALAYTSASRPKK